MRGFRKKSYLGAKTYMPMGHPRMGIPYQKAVCTQVVSDDVSEAGKNSGAVYIPTLEELIVACGNNSVIWSDTTPQASELTG
jgi:hypothetical protein